MSYTAIRSAILSGILAVCLALPAMAQERHPDRHRHARQSQRGTGVQETAVLAVCWSKFPHSSILR